MHINLKTSKRTEFRDITDNLNKIIVDSTEDENAVLIYTKHTTTGLTINENESGLVADMETALKRLVPEHPYAHDRIDNNADAHLRSMLLEHTLVIPIKNKKLDLGTWQRVFFVELDGPRNRTVEAMLL